MQNASAPTEKKPPEIGIVPIPTPLPEAVGIPAGQPDPQAFQNAARLLATLPRWRTARKRLYTIGLWGTLIPSFFLFRYLLGPDWWQGIYGFGLIWIVFLLAYSKGWEWWTGKYRRAISVVLSASSEPSVGPIIDACSLLLVTFQPWAPWAEVKRTLIDRLSRITSPNDDSLTDRQLNVLHDIVQGRHLFSAFDTASHVTILNALVSLGDSRTVACLQELITGGGKFRRNEAVQTGARKYFVYTLTLMRQTRSEADQKVKDLYSGSDKTRDDAVVRAAAQECLVRLQARLAAESQRASLLRSSEQTSLLGATLLRPATTAADSTPPEQLLRAHSES
ncbi:MAG: hypothetical protein JWN14_944 [Chthonomonadales bacterium]|nr:hypothetical protein [Chthonomonadales bacterium]